jgi:hypothetical protein
MRAGHCDVHPLTSPSVPSVHWTPDGYGDGVAAVADVEAVELAPPLVRGVLDGLPVHTNSVEP